MGDRVGPAMKESLILERHDGATGSVYSGLEAGDAQSPSAAMYRTCSSEAGDCVFVVLSDEIL